MVSVDSAAPPWELYERHAELWQSLRVPGVSLERGWLARFSSRLGPEARVLDVGCGHGQPIGAQLLAEGYDVCGFDRAPSLIKEA